MQKRYFFIDFFSSGSSDHEEYIYLYGRNWFDQFFSVPLLFVFFLHFFKGGGAVWIRGEKNKEEVKFAI